MTKLKRTPLFEQYKEHGAKTIDFGGWDLPVQFSSIKEEHEAVRTKAGLFDVSHMGEVEVYGPNALDFLQKVMTNDVAKVSTGQAQYSAMCYENGGTIDDILIYRKSEENYMIVMNASNTKKDIAWMKEHLIEGVKLTDISEETALLAIQGPLAEDVLQRKTTYDLSSIRFFRFVDQDVGGIPVLISRTGYTGEDGFELYCAANDAEQLWGMILAAGKDVALLPCGLGARDTLRFEANLPLYGQELTKDISPLEAGIGFTVKFAKEENFIGKDALMKQKEEGLVRKLVGLEMLEKGIPRTGYEVFSNNVKIGFVTSGTQSPTLKKNMGLALIDSAFTEIGTNIYVQVRKKRLKACVIETPFYKRS